MKKYYLLVITIFIVMSCKKDRQKDNINNVQCKLSSYDYYSVSNFHKKGCITTDLPFSIKIDLNFDGNNEEFLLIETYSKGGFYILYEKIDNNWRIISDKDNININHLGIEIDSTSSGEWKSFKSFEGKNEFNWIWKSDKYINN